MPFILPATTKPKSKPPPTISQLTTQDQANHLHPEPQVPANPTMGSPQTWANPMAGDDLLSSKILVVKYLFDILSLFRSFSRSLLCGLCGLLLHSILYLTQHMKKEQERNEQFCCQVCGQGIYFLANMET